MYKVEELKWNLEEIFTNVEEFHREIETIKRELEQFKKDFYDIDLTPTSLIRILDAKWKLKERVNDVLIYGSLRYYSDVQSEEAKLLKREAEELNSELTRELSFVDGKILALGKKIVDEHFEKEPRLEIYRHHLNDIFRKEEYVQNDETASQIKENTDSINGLLNSYNSLLRETEYGTIELEGETVKITAANFSRYISSRDRETRRQTYFAVNDAFIEKAPEFANILNSIYSFRTQNASIEGYSSVLEKSLFEENIDPQVIDDLIKTVLSNLDLMRRYLNIKSRLLGIEDPHLYDYTVPLDFGTLRKFSLEDAIKITKESLSFLGKDYSLAIDELLKGHIDATPDDRKHQSITFSWGPYSFLNFRDAYGDLKNLIHELGHIINYALSQKKQPFIYADSTVFVGETASIVNEILLTKYLYSHAETDEERAFYLSKEIENYFTSIFKQTMYTEYERELYTKVQKGPLDKDFLIDKYKEIIQKYYGDDVIYDEAAYLDWTRLGHLYRWSYYPYKYATGLLIASIVVSSLERGTLTSEEYIEFLSSGSDNYSLDLLKILKIDLKDSAILQRGFDILESDIEMLERLLEKIDLKDDRQIKTVGLKPKKEEQ